MQYPDPIQLRGVLSQYYNASELRTMCFDMRIDYEDLGGRGKAENAVLLVDYMERAGRLSEIVAYVQSTRPHVQLKMLDTKPEPKADVSRPAAATAPTHIYHVAGDMVQGDKMDGDKVEGDKIVSEDKITIGSIGDNNSGIAIGRGASVENKSDNRQYNVSGGNIMGNLGDGDFHNEGNMAMGDIAIGAEPKNKEEFNQQLSELKELLDKALAGNLFDDEVDGEDAADALEKAIQEADKEEPRADRVVKRLERVSSLIEAGAKAGTAVLKATPIIAGLIKAAGILF